VHIEKILGLLLPPLLLLVTKPPALRSPQLLLPPPLVHLQQRCCRCCHVSESMDIYVLDVQAMLDHCHPCCCCSW
jgi:hypothetical protein